MRKFAILALLFATALSAFAQNVEVFPQMGHTDFIQSVAISPDGRQAVSGCGGDSTIKLWDIATGRLIRTIDVKSPVLSVAFSPDGKQIVSGLWYYVKLWDVNTGSEIRSFSGHKEYVYSVTFSPDGRQIVSGAQDKTIKLWDAATGREVRTFSGHSDTVRSVAFSPDGKQIISGSWDNTIKLWDVATGREVRTFSGHSRGVYSVAFSPDGRQIVSCSWDDTVKLWDAATGREIRALTSPGGGCLSVAFSPDGRQIVFGSGSKIILWDAATGREVRTFSGRSSRVNSVAFSPDGRQIVSGSADKTVKLWDAATGREIRTFSGHSEVVNSVAFSPDGRQIVSGSDDKTLKLWDAATGREVRTFSGHSSRVNSVAFSPDGRQIVSGSIDKTIKLWDAATGREVRTFSGHSYSVFSVAFSPDGRQIVSGSIDKTIKLWDTATGREIRTFSGHSDTVCSIAFNPDGKQIVSCSWDNTVKLWDVSTGKEIRAFSSPGGGGLSVAFSPDGRQIVLGSGVSTVKFWDVATGRETRSLETKAGIGSVAFSPDGKTIISGSFDGTTRLWDISTGKEIAQFIGFDDGEWIVITPDGYYNASPNGDNYLNVRVGNKVYGIDQYRAIFNKPEIVTAKLSAPSSSSVQSGAPSLTSISNAGSFVPPDIILYSPLNNSTITDNAANFSIVVQDQNRPITSVSVMVNGHLHYKSDTPPNRSVALQGPLQLNKTGENNIEIIAFNGVSESRQNITVNWQPRNPSPQRKPNLYVLSIGVEHYDNINSLMCSANDARDIASAFKAQEGLMYNQVFTRVITDEEPILPTADNIRRNLSFLNQGTVDDYFILFLKGHGGSDGQGGFYFTARDFSPSKPSSRINSDEIISVLNAPGKRMVFIDSCHSGGVTGGQDINNEQVARVLKESNAVVFTAARHNQYSWTYRILDHGLFAYSIIKSIKEGRSGTISMLELSSNIIEETKSKAIEYGHEQNPQLSAMSLEDFPIIVRGRSSSSTDYSTNNQPFRPIGSSSPPSTPAPSKPTTASSSSSQLWGAITQLAVWGLQQLLRY